jgi:hypothetical protein
MQMIVLVGRLMRQPLWPVVATLASAIAAKSGTLSVSFAYLGAVMTFVLTRALVAAIARVRRYE